MEECPQWSQSLLHEGASATHPQYERLNLGRGGTCMCGPHAPHVMQQCARWQGMGVVEDVCIGPRDVFWGLLLDGPGVARGRCAQGVKIHN